MTTHPDASIGRRCAVAGDEADIILSDSSGSSDKDGGVIMSKSVVTHGRKALFVLIPELCQGFASGIREGEPLSPDILDSASFYELELEDLSEVVVGLYSSAQDGYELKVDFEKERGTQKRTKEK